MRSELASRELLELEHDRLEDPSCVMGLRVYYMLDSFSRKILGHRVDERDVDAPAVDVFQ